MAKDIRDGIDSQLDGATQGGPTRVTAEAGGARAAVDVVDSGRIGAVVDRIRVDGPSTDFAGRAKALAGNLRPGGERLVPVEVDPGLGGAVLRSNPKDMRGRRFFQVDIDASGAELTRHRVGDDGRRTREPYAVTRDHLGELLDGMEHGVGLAEEE